MKKTASLLLTFTLLTSLWYSAVEYYRMVAYQKEQSWIQQMQNAPDSEFKVIKLNATLYTFIEDSEIEQVNENVVIDNKVYHIFKKSIKDNVINLYYLGQENQNAIDISLQKLVDAQSDSNTKSPIEKLLKNFTKDYVANEYKSFVYKLKATSKTTSVFENNNPKLLSGYSKMAFSPPKMVLIFYSNHIES
jgi:hypothetical protein